MRRLVGIVFCCFIAYVPTQGQNVEYPEFTGAFDKTPLKEALNAIGASTNVSIFYHVSWTRDVSITASFYKTPLMEVITEVLSESGLTYMSFDENNLVILNEEQPLFLIDLMQNSKSGTTTSNLVIIGENLSRSGQATLSGVITDGGTGDPLPGATIYFEELKDGVVTRPDGTYQMQLTTGKYNVRIESVGFEHETRQMQIVNSGTFDLEIFTSATQLNEVLIRESRIDENVQAVQSGLEKMDMKVFKTLPQFMGEVDIIKGLIVLPGVSTVGEGASGFNVRGGTVGQNLLLQDQALVFNTSHLFGFFSAFNPEVVKGVTLHKGNPPATEGGRLSSILEVRLRNGDGDRIHVSGGIGTVSSKLVVDGPIAKGKGNFLLGGRISYINWFLHSLNNAVLKQSSANFYDLNARFNYNITKKDIVTLSAYKSFDDFRLVSDTTFTWETQNISAIWRHSFNPSLLSEFAVAYGQYNSDTWDNEGPNQFDLESYVHHLKLKGLFTYISSNHKIDFGVSAIRYDLEPGLFVPREESSNLQAINVENDASLETALFVNDEFKITDKLSLTAGLRYSHFQALGPRNVYLYEVGIPKEDDSIVDTLHFNNNETIKAYGGLEPRVSLRYLLNPSTSIRVGYARNRQYLHLVSNTTAVSPQDYWVNSNYHIPPEVGDQFSVGYFKNFQENAIELSTEVFYKYSTGSVDYKEGSTVLLNETLEQAILSGNGRAYGLEVMVKKNVGRLTGRVSYTYSRSERRFESENRTETISLGEYYPTNYDRPNELSVLGNYQLSRGVKFTANFTYASGRPVTAPVSKYSQQHVLSVLNYSQRNQYRIPNYHRLDISFIFGVGLRKDRKINDEFIFSIYNVYGRRNAYSVYFNQSGTAYRLSVLGTIFPSISYNFKI